MPDIGYINALGQNAECRVPKWDRYVGKNSRVVIKGTVLEICCQYLAYYGVSTYCSHNSTTSYSIL